MDKYYEVQVINEDGTLDILEFCTFDNVQDVMQLVENHFKEKFLFRELVNPDGITYIHGFPLHGSNFQVYIVED